MSDIRALLALLERRFDECGYRLRKSNQDFVKTDDQGNVAAISVDLLRSSTKGAKKVSTHCHIRIEAIEAVYAKHHPSLSKSEQKSHYTLHVNCDNLYPSDCPLMGSLNVSSETLPEVSRLAWQAISEHVFPFVERYSDRYRLAENLASENPRERVTSDPVVRHAVLMAQAALENDRPSFDEYGEEFFAHCSKFAPERQPLAESIYRGIKQEYFD